MADQAKKIRSGRVVELDYQLTLDDGEVVESTAEQEPLEYTQGGGQIIPGLESALEGTPAGESKQIVLEPQDAFGEYDPQGRFNLPREQFPPDLELKPNMQLNLRDSSGNPVPTYVIEVGDEQVTLDLNHPLAGERLTFDVTVREVREPE